MSDLIAITYPTEPITQVSRTERMRSLHARLAGILADEGDAISVCVTEGVVHVTAQSKGQRCRLEIDLRDPDAELVLLAKLACFVERIRHSAA